MRVDPFNATFTKAGCAGLVLVLLMPTLPRAIGETNAIANYSVRSVTAYVRLVDPYSPETLKDRSKVVAWLVPVDTGQKPRPVDAQRHYQIIQHHKRFEPRLLVVPAGSIVEFPNRDPWLHNVFSRSRSKRFDLGLYQAGVQKMVRFDRAGISYLFCSIHPEMMAIVLSIDSPYFGVSDESGHISIGNVPPGKYLLHLWYENATSKALEGLQRFISVGDDARNSLPMISITLSVRIPIADRDQKPRSSHFVGEGDAVTKLAHQL